MKKTNNGMKKATVFALAAACMATLAAPETVLAEETGVMTEETNVSAGRVAQRYEAKDGTWDAGTGKLTLKNGETAKDCFFCDGTYTYYLQHDGTPMKNRLTYHPDGEHIIYFDENGHEVFSNFKNVKQSIAGEPVDDLCFFDVYGYMYVDFITYDQAGVNLYYANPYGVMERNGWFTFSDKQGGGMGYANADGTLMKDTWTYDANGNYVYMEGDGSVRGSRGGQDTNTGNNNTTAEVTNGIYTGRNGVNPNVVITNESFHKDTGSHGRVEVRGDYITYGGYSYPIATINATSANYHFGFSSPFYGDFPLGNTIWNGVDFASIFTAALREGETWDGGFDMNTAINWFMHDGIYERATSNREWFRPDYYACNYYEELSSMYGKDMVYYYLDYACYGLNEGKQAGDILPEREKFYEEYIYE